MDSGFGDNIYVLNTGGSKKRAHRLRLRDTVPWIEAFVEVGPDRPHRFPERGGGRLEESRTPGCNSKLAAWAHEPPQFAHCGFHVGYEEDAEDTHNRVEAGIRKSEIEHVRSAKLEIIKSGLFCLT